MREATSADTERLIQHLVAHPAFPHPVRQVHALATHISHVLLTGDYAYKIKKPVDLGFVDYTSLAKRRHFCEEELRLNRRLAPDLYLGVVAITGSHQQPVVGGDGPAIEYAVQMREFRQQDQWDKRLEAGNLGVEQVEQLADTLAAFHARAEPVRPGEGLGDPDRVTATLNANFEATAPFVPQWIDPAAFEQLFRWTQETLQRHRPTIAQRLADGFVRNCHGDAHLQNIATVDGQLALFDCIEFNRAFRYIDVMAEIAFTQMDLDARGYPHLANRFLNRYLEQSGDYAGLSLLPLYLSYRAYVRAKVACLSPNADPQNIQHLIALAQGYTRPGRPGVILMHGLSGSGKSHVAAELVARIGAVQIRSDRERKRIAASGRARRVADRVPADARDTLYNKRMTRATYARLMDLAGPVLNAGFPVILDATFLKAEHRDSARALAQQQRVPLVIVDCHAEPGELERRIIARAAARGNISDATPAVMRAQQANRNGFTPWEQEHRIAVDTQAWDSAALADQVHRHLTGTPASMERLE